MVTGQSVFFKAKKSSVVNGTLVPIFHRLISTFLRVKDYGGWYMTTNGEI